MAHGLGARLCWPGGVLSELLPRRLCLRLGGCAGLGGPCVRVASLPPPSWLCGPGPRAHCHSLVLRWGQAPGNLGHPGPQDEDSTVCKSPGGRSLSPSAAQSLVCRWTFPTCNFSFHFHCLLQTYMPSDPVLCNLDFICKF